MAPRPSVAVCLVLAAAVLARAGDGDTPAPSKPADAVKYGPAPEGLRLEIKAPKSAYWPGEPIRPEVSLVNEAKDAISIVLPAYGSEGGAREPLLSWSAAYVTADGSETPVAPYSVARCGTGIDFVWQDDVVALKTGGREALAPVEDPAATLDLQQPGKVRLRLRYAYSAGKAVKAPAVANVPKDTGAMGAREPFELVGAVDVTVERALDVTVQAAAPTRAGTVSRLTDVLEVRAIGKDGKPRTLAASQWDVRLVFDASEGLGLDTSKCWEPRALARDAAVPGSGQVTVALDPSMTLRAAKPGTCRVRAVLRSLDPAGGARIESAWTELRFTE